MKHIRVLPFEMRRTVNRHCNLSTLDDENLLSSLSDLPIRALYFQTHIKKIVNKI